MTRKTVRILALLLALPLGCAAKQEREPSAPSESAPSGAPAFATPPAAAPAPAPAEEAEKDALQEGRDDRDDLASAQADLEAARRELERALEPIAANKPSATTGGGSGAAPPPAAAPRRSSPADAADEAPKSRAEKKSGETSCQTACRAFQSLGRAASSICRIAGDKDER
jgi:hypothetical protein